jgi:hypothetical protein
MNGATIHQAAHLLAIGDHQASGRIRELVLRGLVVDSGQRRRNPHSGLRAIVWRAA